MAQTEIDYNEWFYGKFGAAAKYVSRAIEAGQGELAAGTVMVLNPATNKYVKWDSASVAAVLTVAAPAVTTVDAVTASGTPDTKEAVVKTVAAPAVTTGAVNTSNIVGVCVLLEAIDATSEATGKIGIIGNVLESALVLAGSTITTVTNYVKAILQMNGIDVVTGSNAINVAGV